MSDRIERARAKIIELLGFEDPDDGAKLGWEKLVELAAQMRTFISDNADLFGQPHDYCLEKLQEKVERWDETYAWHLAEKLVTCFRLHNIASSSDSDATQYWMLELADF